MYIEIINNSRRIESLMGVGNARANTGHLKIEDLNLAFTLASHLAVDHKQK